MPADFSDTNFRLRLTAAKGCGTAGLTLNVDMIQVRVYYSMSTTTTTTSVQTTAVADQNLQGPGTACGSGIANCFRADGATLNPRGFWGTMNTQGAENVNGDAYQTFYDTRTSANNPAYDAVNYFNYAIEMPAGVHATAPSMSTTPSSARSRSTRAPATDGSAVRLRSARSTRCTTRRTRCTTSSDDGAALASSNDLFRDISAADTAMGGQRRIGVRPVHGRHLRRRPRLPQPVVPAVQRHERRRRRATSIASTPRPRTRPIPTAQKGTNGENSFALYASATRRDAQAVRTGRDAGLHATVRLRIGRVQSEFYLAQIDANYAGKTIEIQLWDPGDTNPLSAVLAILAANLRAAGRPTAISYTATKATTNSGAANCNSLTGTGVMSVQTNVGATERHVQRLLADHPGARSRPGTRRHSRAGGRSATP